MKSNYTTFKSLLVACLLAGSGTSLSALDYYWVGGSGEWSDHNNHWATVSGGNIFHDQVPTSMDNVYFDANSFPAGGTVAIDQTIIYCMDMDWSGADTWGTVEILALGNNTLSVFGSMTLIPALQWNFAGTVEFSAFHPGKTIYSAGKQFTYALFDGSGGEWTLLDDLNVLYWRFRNGVLRTNDKQLNVYSFEADQPGNMELHLGASHLYFQGYFRTYTYLNNHNLTIFPGTSTIHFQNPATLDVKSYGSGYNFYDVIFEKNGHVLGDNTFHELRFMGDGQIGQTNYWTGNNTFEILTLTGGTILKLGSQATQHFTPTGDINIVNAGCGLFVTIISDISGDQTTIEKPVGTLDVVYALLMDVQATGGAAFLANNSIDAGNNTNWAFTPPPSRTLYWVGGAGDWNDPLHWATISGGTGGNCIPASVDAVFFDQNSGFSVGNNLVQIPSDVNAFCRNMDWTAVTGLPVFTGNKLFLYGSIALSPNMDFDIQQVFFRATTLGNTILSAGRSFEFAYFEGAGGEWTLLDDLTMNFWRFQNGVFRTNDKRVDVYAFEADQPGNMELHLGNSHLYFQGYFRAYPYLNNHNLTVFPGTSTIHFINPANLDVYSSGLGYNFYNVIFEKNGFVLGNNTFHELRFEDDGQIGQTNYWTSNNTFEILTLTGGKILKLGSETTQYFTTSGTINLVNADCNLFVTIVSDITGDQTTIEKPGGALNVNFVLLMDVLASGGATFTAGNSIDAGNNTNWTFIPPVARTLYWVGGAGDWDDPSHWATGSGGVGGNCIPAAVDSVVFDQNAGFTFGNNQIQIPTSVNAFCKSMNWTAVTGLPVFSGDKLLLYGSLALSPSMDFSIQQVYFRATTLGNTILSAGKAIQFSNFEGSGGEWTLLDDLSMVYWRFQNGIIRTNNKQINVYAFESNQPGEMELHLGSSHLYFQGYFSASAHLNNHHLTIFPGTSTIHFLNHSTLGVYQYHGSGYNFHDVIFEKNGYVFGNNTFHELRFEGDGQIGQTNYFNSKNTFDILTFSPGKTYVIQANTTQTITPLGNFIAQGYGGFPIEIKSDRQGTQATLHKDGDPICLDFLYMTDIAGTGTAFGYAGANSDNVFNNSGWIFEACPACFNAPPAPAPVLDPASLIPVQPASQATLILANLPAGAEAVWFNADQSTELYASADNHFQPLIGQNSKFYGAFRDLQTGCVSAVLEVVICIQMTFDPLGIVPSCAGGSSGAITVLQISGGQPPYQYALDNAGFQNSPLFAGLGVGTYTITVQDAHACTANVQAIIPPGPIDPIVVACPTVVPNLQANSHCQATLGDYTGLATLSGGCGIPLNPMVQTPPPGTLVNPGTVAIALTVSNTAGQSASCVFNVTIGGGCGGN